MKENLVKGTKKREMKKKKANVESEKMTSSPGASILILSQH